MVPPEIAPLEFLIGQWGGAGRGDYPTVEPFAYTEEVSFVCPGRPFLVYTQRTADATSGAPLHTETGYLRMPTSDAVELILAQPSGIAEVHSGKVIGTSLELRSTVIATTPTAQSVSAVERVISVTGDELRYALRLAAVGHPLQTHLEAVLRRRGAAD